jgi:CBS domain containing-hemolysin-like protein
MNIEHEGIHRGDDRSKHQTMNNLGSIPSAAATRARRAMGGLFFSFFGGVWLGVAWFLRFRRIPMVLVLVLAGTLAMMLFAYVRYRQYRWALAAEATSPARRRAGRWFILINAGQWILILVVGNVLANLGLGAWVVPAAMLIVGLHFLPLARIFSNSAHFVTGTALVVVAIGYPALAPAGPKDAVACLAAGLILWASAFWAVLALVKIPP